MNHTHWMHQAIALAKQAHNMASPNPRVGCVIIKNNQLIGQGYHQQYGHPHAEINALKNCTQSPKGAQLYVTLEPCCHTGQTAPCTKAIIKAGISEVYFGHLDPDVHVNGKGHQALLNAGILVKSNVCEALCKALNPGFLKRQQQHKIWLCAKSATTINGLFYTPHAPHITSAGARAHIHLLRAQVDAIITSANTVLADQPKYTVRPSKQHAIYGFKQPTLIILDTHCRIPYNHPTLMHDPKRQIIIFSASHKPQDFYPSNVQQISTPKSGDILDLKWVMHYLAEHFYFNEIMLEAGPTLLLEFLSESLIDAWHFYMHPSWQNIGGSYPACMKHISENFEAQHSGIIDNTFFMQMKKQTP